jgi:hypothetical protein
MFLDTDAVGALALRALLVVATPAGADYIRPWCRIAV